MIAPQILPACLLFITVTAAGQAKLRKLATNINHPAINNFAPFISLDGNSMVYLADVGEDHALTMSYTTRVGVNWKDPVTLPRSVNNHLNFAKGYALSPDGKTLYISNMKGNGMGGFDLYASRQKGLTWEEPENMLLPANSKAHDACPSISLDGSMFFFMRCDKMDFTKADGCRIFMMTKKPNGQWDTPVELPAFINSGNSQSPRIMGDGEMLIFSSDRLQPNQGGMDLYYTRLIRNQWTKPQPLSFANTPADDQFVSASSVGMYLLRESPGQRSSELVELLFPSDMRPRGTLRVEGIVSGPQDPSSAFVSVYNLDEKSQGPVIRPSKDGSFITYMNYGRQYELSVEPLQDNYTFYSRLFDLRGEANPMIERVQVTLGPASSGDGIDLVGVLFEPHTSSISNASSEEIRRVARMMRGNPDKSFSIEVTLHGYREDSLRADPDLTETIYDSLLIPVTYAIDSVITIPGDSVTMASRDSVITITRTRHSWRIRPRYHNDRTLRQAKAVESALLHEGIPQSKMASSGKAIVEALPEKRRTLVRVIVH